MTADTAATGLTAFADLTLDPGTGRFTRAGRRGVLTATEAKLLALLMASPRVVVPRRALLREIWGYDTFRPAVDPVDMHVMMIRRKTEFRVLPRLVHAVRGVGFVLCEPDEPAAGGGLR